MSFQAATGELGSPVRKSMPKDKKRDRVSHVQQCVLLCLFKSLLDLLSSENTQWSHAGGRGNACNYNILKHSQGASMTADFGIGYWDPLECLKQKSIRNHYHMHIYIYI